MGVLGEQTAGRGGRGSLSFQCLGLILSLLELTSQGVPGAPPPQKGRKRQSQELPSSPTTDPPPTRFLPQAGGGPGCWQMDESPGWVVVAHSPMTRLPAVAMTIQGTKLSLGFG